MRAQAGGTAFPNSVCCMPLDNFHPLSLQRCSWKGTLDISPTAGLTVREEVGYRVALDLALAGTWRKYTEGWRQNSLCSWSGQVGRPRGGCQFKNTHAAWHSTLGGAGPRPALKIQEWQGFLGADTLYSVSGEWAPSNHGHSGGVLLPHPEQASSSSLGVQGCQRVDGSHFRCQPPLL